VCLTEVRLLWDIEDSAEKKAKKFRVFRKFYWNGINYHYS